MKRLFHSSIALLCLGTFGASSWGVPGTGSGSRNVARERVGNRDELLAAINVWQKRHHQAKWTMDELIGHAVDQAYFIYFVYGDSPFDPPLESFLIHLIKNRPFEYDVRLRSNWRREITIHTTPDQIARQRREWETSRKDYRSWEAISGSPSDFVRRLPLPPHHSLTLEILSKPNSNRQGQSLHRTVSASILLASALAKKELPGHNPAQPIHSSPPFAATPTELLSILNDWEKSMHRPEITLDEVTARFADAIINLRESNDSVWDFDLEPVLECLARDVPFVHSMPVSVDGLSEPGEMGSFHAVSINKDLPVPPRRTASVIVSIFPPDMKEEEPLEDVWKTIILSCAFPAKVSQAKAAQSKVGR